MLHTNAPSESVSGYLHWVIKANAMTSHELTVLWRETVLQQLVKDPTTSMPSFRAALVEGRNRDDIRDHTQRAKLRRRSSAKSFSLKHSIMAKMEACPWHYHV
uniref:Uncharacterized protein n=1 Tax=Plectus sambesii TaxID=2011161 RepID=A0A914WN05_9BILA